VTFSHNLMVPLVPWKRKTLPDPFAKAICRTVRHSDQDAVTMYLETDSAHLLMRGPGASRCCLELFVLAV